MCVLIYYNIICLPSAIIYKIVMDNIMYIKVSSSPQDP